MKNIALLSEMKKNGYWRSYWINEELYNTQIIFLKQFGSKYHAEIAHKSKDFKIKGF